MRLGRENKLIMPWEEERNRIPVPLKMVWFLFVAAILASVFFGQCSVSEVDADPLSIPAVRDLELQRRQTKALESIADSLKKIALEMERKR